MKRIVAILMALLAAQALLAQTSIRVQAPNVVAADEQFNVTFIIEGENAPSSFEWEAGDDFQLVWGPQRGTSSSISIVNGKRTRSSQTTYTYVLMPRRAGTFEIPTATAVVKGNTLTSGKASVEVVSGGASSRGGNAASSGGSVSATGDIADADLFLRLTLSRTSVVVGEPVTATLKLYQRVNIAGLEDAKFPSFNGFWSQETAAPSSIEFRRESYNDMIYNAALLRSWTLIPQQAGTLRIDPAELVCLVNVRNASTSGSIFDSFFDDYRTVRKRVYSSAYEVRVSPLPAGAPASFHGGVGSFTMDVALTRDSLKAHDAASLKVTVSGTGNVALLEAPVIQFPPDFEVYDMKTAESAGSKTFEFPFIPRSHGEFALDPVEYSYYDIRNRRYVTLRSEPMTLRVAPGAGGDAAAGGTLIQGANRRDVKDLGSDIRFIKTGAPSFARAGSFFVGSAGFWAAAAALVAAA
ncbi:MAG: BatD family protein, partial [Bacteroidales bacterium]|nr:BatD family protein [Bacteroidales bacterium]